MTAPTLAPTPLRGRDSTVWERSAAGDARAREQLVQRYLRLARMLARRYSHTSEPIEDLEQVACIGLMHAIDRFDPSRNVEFSTFAVPTILGELRRHFRDRTWSLRVPRDLRDAAIAVERANDRLATELGRSPSVAEVAGATGLPAERVLEAREAGLAYRADSLDRPLHADDDDAATLGDSIGSGDDDLREAENGILLEQITAATLSDRDREVLRLRVKEDLLQREIAERVGVSQMQVSRILRDSLARLEVIVQR